MTSGPGGLARVPLASCRVPQQTSSADNVAAVLVVTDLQDCPWEHERAVITIGAYDGVHIGHRAVIEQVRRRAEEVGGKSVVARMVGLVGAESR